MERKDTSRIAEEAAEWLEALAEGGTQTRADFAAWLRASPRHVEELLMMQALDDEAGRMDPQRRMDVEKLLAQSNVISLATQHAPTPTLPRRTGEGAFPWRWAAGITALAVALAFAWQVSGTQTFTTAVGEQRAIELEDGSIVHLNARSEVAIHFSNQARDIDLLAGEALFKVARNPRRPFRVHAGDTVIRAVGTQFNVYRHDNSTTVAVIEGRVEISGKSPSRQLAAGEAARVTPAGALARTHVDAAEATAWRQRRLIFRDSTLGDIAAEFNRYNRTPQIAVEGDALRARRYGGTFDADDPESLVDFLRPDGNLQIDHAGANLIIRSRILK